MSMPFYVAPEQVMKDKADFARKGIARGRSLVALAYDDGILICAENPSTTLRKISEIYDRIAFAGVGKYNEYDRLRIAGVRHADLKGYSFSREDVDAQSLANAYAQMLGDVFTHEMKPMEVEILVAEVGDDRGRRPAVPHPLRRHRRRRAAATRVLGGEAEAIVERLEGQLRGGAVASTPRCAPRSAALAGPDRSSPPASSRSPCSSRGNGRRAFRRLDRRRRGRRCSAGGAVAVEATEDVPTAETTTTEVAAEDADAAAAESGPADAERERRPAATSPEPASARRVIARSSSVPGQHQQAAEQRRGRQQHRRERPPTAPGRRVRRPASASPPSAGRVVGLLADDLAGHRQVVLGHEHDHGTDGVGPVDAAAQLPDDALGAQVRGDDAGLERRGRRRERHHRPDRHGPTVPT